MQLLSPRKDIGKATNLARAKKKKDRDGKEHKEKLKDKENELESDLINLDNYVAVDPKTRLHQLKEEKKFEEELIINARKENLRRVSEEISQGPYCICGKGINGFMVRCSLCYNWYHGTCVALPKTVNGKLLSKNQNSFEIMRELKYMCPLCIRTRRPRLEMILSLLVSLQKLPVRLPEGEALQFLMEKVMQWKEKVKKVLKDSRLQKLLQQMKCSTETNGGNAKSSTQITFKRMMMENDHTNARRMSSQKDLLSSEDIIVTEDSVQEIEEVHSLPIVRPRAKLTGEQARSGAENKHVDDSLTLECEEEMTESPKSAGSRDESKEGVIDLEEPKILTVVKQCRPLTPVDVCDLSDVSVNGNNGVSRKKGLLEDSVLNDVENLLMEGDLLEVTLDETQQLWTVLQSERPLLLEHCKIMVSTYNAS